MRFCLHGVFPVGGAAAAATRRRLVDVTLRNPLTLWILFRAMILSGVEAETTKYTANLLELRAEVSCSVVVD